MATTYVEMTQGTPTSTRKCTYSGWHKKCEAGPSVSQSFFSIGLASDSHYTDFRYETDDAIRINIESAAGYTIKTTRLFRDPGAWMNVVIAIDTEQSVAADRIKLYINGVQETSFSETNYPAEDYDIPTLVSGDKFSIGRRIRTGTMYFNGNMSWVQFIDGLQLAATEFGSVDSTSGVWKIKPAPYGTPGTNGFALAMEDRSNLDLDSSSNAHTMTTVGTLTATYDNPSNNFSTMNILNAFESAYSFTNGNTSVWTSAQWSGMCSSLQMIKGKWYVEFKLTGTGVQAGVFFGAGTGVSLGTRQMNQANYGYASYQADGFERQAWGSNKVTNDSSTAGYGTTMAENDIGMIALDTTNGIIWTGVNGTWDNSATTGEIASSDISNSMFNRSGYSPGMVPGYYAFTCAVEGTSITGLVNWNFGNGYYGTTAVSSAVADGNGEGAFEYTPPTGYYALCTNNISDQGG